MTASSANRVEFPEARALPRRLRLPTQLGLAALSLLFVALPLAALGPSGLLLTLAVALPLALQAALHGRANRSVSASRHKLYIGGREVLRRRDLGYAYYIEDAAGVTVHLLPASGSELELHLPDRARADALLDHLDVRDLPVARFRLDSPASSKLPPWVAWSFAGIVILSNAAGVQRLVEPRDVLALLLAWACFAAFIANVGAELAVGDDAVVFRWFGREQVIPIARIREVRAVVEGVRLNLTSGEVLEFHLRHAPPRFDRALRKDQSVAAWQSVIIERVERARQRLRASAPALRLPPLSADSPAAWVEALRGARRGAHYRDESVTDAQLWDAVEDPQVDGAYRAAAAITLSPSLDASGRERLRIAAEGTATPRVRIALEAVSRGDDEALLEAVEAIALESRR